MEMEFGGGGSGRFSRKPKPNGNCFGNPLYVHIVNKAAVSAFWIAGFMFTAGYIGPVGNTGFWVGILRFLVFFVFWPLLLGEKLAGR